jgi:hypothetical protein
VGFSVGLTGFGFVIGFSMVFEGVLSEGWGWDDVGLIVLGKFDDYRGDLCDLNAIFFVKANRTRQICII